MGRGRRDLDRSVGSSRERERNDYTRGWGYRRSFIWNEGEVAGERSGDMEGYRAVYGLWSYRRKSV